MGYPARFFDGESAKAHAALVELGAGVIHIYPTGSAEGPLVLWHIDEVVEDPLSNKRKTVLRISASPQSLEIEDPDFSNQIRRHFPTWKPTLSVLGSSRNIRSGALASLILIFVSVLCLVFMVLLPWLAEGVAKSMPQKWELDLGLQLKQGFLKDDPGDTAKTRLLNAFYAELKPLPVRSGGSTHEVPPIEMTVARSSMFNAFALPGRQVVVFQGAIDEMETPEELVALLGHECGHVEARHVTRSLFRTLSTYLAISVFLGDVGGITGVLIENANTLRQLSYSRDFEREADEQSHQLLCQNGLDPAGTVRLMKALDEVSSVGFSKETSFLSSHPITGERIESARKRTRAQPCAFGSVPPRMELLFRQLKSKPLE